MAKRCFPFGARLVVPSTFEECLSYEQQVLYLAKKIDELEERVEELEGNSTAEPTETSDVTPRV